MLKFFRDQKNSWLMKGILILTALSFISLFRWGNIAEQIPDESKAIAVVDGKKITVAQFINEFYQKVKSVGKITQAPFTVKDAIESGMLLPELNQIVSRAVMEAAVNNLKLTVPDNDVRDAVKNMLIFGDVDGSFSMAAYKKYLSDMGLSEKRFIDDIFLDMRTQQLTTAAGTLSAVPQSMAETAYNVQNEKRSADVFTITPAKLKITGKPTAQEKEALYKELAEQLTAPEYRSFTVMFLTLDEVSKKINLSEQELLEVFNENKDSYTIEEIRDVDQMLFDSKEEADKAYSALQKGQKFMDVAQKFAHQTEDQTKLGDVTPSTATGDWADVVFTAKKGEIIAPVQTAFGWQILRVNSITPKVERKFKEVRDEIEQKLIASMAFDTLSETAVALDDRFGAGETIEDVAKSTGFPVKKFTLIDSAGLDENGKKADISQNVLATAFAADAGKESPMVEDGTGFFVLRVDEVRDPVVKPIEKSQKEIQEAWLSEKQQEKAKQIAQDIETLLNKGISPKEISKQTGVPYQRLKEITRHDSKLPAAVLYRLFNEPVKTVVTYPSASELLVARTISVTPANPKKDVIGVAGLRRQMREQMAKEKADAVLADYAVYLGIKIHEDTVQKAFSYLTKSIQQNEEDY
ncbi:MAG: SurA N-terminal domain-containing protein [Alphaproteobacteria bacterium]|nr:SurA N-terminal domain-containing protein [Alphaproteobacteria bacterium]MBO4644126.1 SurA N-terminal domain-containing protein [Alphaproteobacteria bacterium]